MSFVGDVCVFCRFGEEAGSRRGWYAVASCRALYDMQRAKAK